MLRRGCGPALHSRGMAAPWPPLLNPPLTPRPAAPPARSPAQVLDKAYFLGLLKAHRAEVAATTRDLHEELAGADGRQATAARLEKRVDELRVGGRWVGSGGAMGRPAPQPVKHRASATRRL